MNKRKMKQRSAFARVLGDLLDATGLFERKEWAELLGVPEAAISQWVNDKTIPRADHLFLVVNTLKWADLEDETPLLRYDHIAEEPSVDVSPHGTRMRPTIAQYISKPTVFNPRIGSIQPGL